MGIRRNLTLAFIMAAGLASLANSAGRAAQTSPGSISGKAAKNLVKKDEYSNYSVRARNVDLGQIGNTVPLDPKLEYILAELTVPGKYLIELYDNKHLKVVCTEGPFELTEPAPIKADVTISCGKPLLGYYLLGAAIVTGVTTAVVAQSGPASPAQ